MEYLSVEETAGRWGVSARSVRNYCSQGRVEGARLIGKKWLIPSDAGKPSRANAAAGASSGAALLEALRREKAAGMRGGIYHRVQVDLAYNSNHMEGSTLTHEQTRLIFETATIAPDGTDGAVGAVRVDDVIEAANHFRCLDLVIDRAGRPVTERLVKQLHRTLKAATADTARDWFAVGDYKRLPNEVGGRATTPPERVAAELGALIERYEHARAAAPATFDELLDFHVAFERIHPFQDGNGRVGRLLLFKECLRAGIVPFIIGDDMKLFYYRGLAQWDAEPGYLRDTCLTAQDRFQLLLSYFRIG